MELYVQLREEDAVLESLRDKSTYSRPFTGVKVAILLFKKTRY